jgi:hypothetical protein
VFIDNSIDTMKTSLFGGGALASFEFALGLEEVRLEIVPGFDCCWFVLPFLTLFLHEGSFIYYCEEGVHDVVVGDGSTGICCKFAADGHSIDEGVEWFVGVPGLVELVFVFNNHFGADDGVSKEILEHLADTEVGESSVGAFYATKEAFWYGVLELLAPRGLDGLPLGVHPFAFGVLAVFMGCGDGGGSSFDDGGFARVKRYSERAGGYNGGVDRVSGKSAEVSVGSAA